MGFSWRKSIKLGGGARLNLSKSGVGASWGIKGFRFGVSPRGGRADSQGCGILVVAVLVIAVVVKIVQVVVSAVVAVFSTPYPWIAIGLGLAGYGTYHAVRVFRRQRLQKLYFDTVAALDAGGSQAKEHLTQLGRQGADQADALLLYAAGVASIGNDQEALFAVQRAQTLLSTLGELSGGIDLQFPIVPVSMHFAADAFALGRMQLAHAALLVFGGRPQDAINELNLNPSQADNPVALAIAAEAFRALDEPMAAVGALQRATATTSEPSLLDLLHYKMASAFETAGMLGDAAREYAKTAFSDARTKLQALQVAETARLRDLQVANAEREARVTAAADEQIFQRTLDVICSACGQHERRAVLETGLRALHGAEIRQRLRAEADAMEPALVRAEKDKAHRAMVESDNAAFSSAMTMLEAAKGPAGRRSALQAGRDAIRQTGMQQRLALEASKIEVQAVLDKVDGLKTAAAKRRHLTTALEAIRSDEVRDELQAEQIGWLRDALREIDG